MRDLDRMGESSAFGLLLEWPATGGAHHRLPDASASRSPLRRLASMRSLVHRARSGQGEADRTRAGSSCRSPWRRNSASGASGGARRTGRPSRASSAADPRPSARRGEAQAFGQRALRHQAERHGLAVRDAVGGRALEGVRHGVAGVEDRAAPASRSSPLTTSALISTLRRTSRVSAVSSRREQRAPPPARSRRSSRRRR